MTDVKCDKCGEPWEELWLQEEADENEEIKKHFKWIKNEYGRIVTVMECYNCLDNLEKQKGIKNNVNLL